MNIFLSYSREDLEAAQQLKSALEAQGLNVWFDYELLDAGRSWREQLIDGLRQADAIVALLSIESKANSNFLYEIGAATASGKPLFIVAVDSLQGLSLPFNLTEHHIIDVSSDRGGGRWDGAAKAVRAGLAMQAPLLPAKDGAVAELAGAIAAERRGQGQSIREADTLHPNSVFLVHGHDEAMLRAVEGYLTELGVNAIVMKDIGDRSMSLLQRFFKVSADAHFAIVLISTDDLGGERRKVQRWGIGKWALRLRARQNVILELGYFFGLLGWERVFVLQRASRDEFREFEMPSDLHGVPVLPFDDSGAWRPQIRARLMEHKFKLSTQ